MALTSLTAIWALEDTAKLKQGETILIQGGAGGVAGFAIQLAKHIGATVITTASARNHDYVKSLGADRVIDYNAEDFTKIGRDLRRRVRHGRRRGAGALLRRAEAGRPPGVDRRRRRPGSSRAARTCRCCARASPATAPISNA